MEPGQKVLSSSLAPPVLVSSGTRFPRLFTKLRRELSIKSSRSLNVSDALDVACCYSLDAALASDFMPICHFAYI